MLWFCFRSLEKVNYQFPTSAFSLKCFLGFWGFLGCVLVFWEFWSFFVVVWLGLFFGLVLFVLRDLFVFVIVVFVWVLFVFVLLLCCFVFGVFLGGVFFPPVLLIQHSHTFFSTVRFAYRQISCHYDECSSAVPGKRDC